MPADIEALVERLWSADFPNEEAARIFARLRPEETEALRLIVARLEERVQARRVLRADGERYATLREPAERSVRYTGLLILLTLAVHHSDALLYLPAELRAERLADWASRTGCDLDFVKEAAILGPTGLIPMLRAA